MIMMPPHLPLDGREDDSFLYKMLIFCDFLDWG